MHTNYHISHPQVNIFHKSLYFIIGLIAILNKKIDLIKIKTFKTGLIVKLNQILNRIYTHSVGVKTLIQGFDLEKAREEYPKALNQLEEYRSFYLKLEKVDFFNNNETKELADQTLSNLYKIEFHLRFITFTDISKNNEDKTLKDFASSLPLGTIHA